MKPLPYRVTHRQVETTDTVTLTLEPIGPEIGSWAPGQFTMVYAFGVGEVPVSISGGSCGLIQHTVRDVGAVTHAICTAQPGTVLGLHGPYGHGWELDHPPAEDLVVLAGGIGLAPLRPVITEALARPGRFGHVCVLIGARQPADLIYTHEYGAWRAAGAQVLVTVDRADRSWRGPVGVVTGLLLQARFAAPRTAAFVCGPEVMMRFAARDLHYLGVPLDHIRVSLERNMQCGTGQCGHCQLGELVVCRDGPVVGWDVAAPLLSVKEL
jgi:NAD(P)H-flavin reductase